MIDWFACELKRVESNLSEKVGLILVATYKDESDFLSLYIYFFDKLGLALTVAVLRLIEGYVAVPEEALIIMLGKVVQYVDSGRHLRGMGDYLYGTEKDGLKEGYRQLLRVVAESLRLPGTVPREQVCGRRTAALTRTGLHLEPGLHNKKYRR